MAPQTTRKLDAILESIEAAITDAITNEVTIAIEANASIPAIGAVNDTAWSGTGNGTLVALLKAIYGELVTANGLLDDIKTNTTPTP